MRHHTLYSVDAWAEADGGWSYNDTHRIGEVDDKDLRGQTGDYSVRRILRAFREVSGYKLDRCTVEFSGTTPEAVEVLERGTRRPLLMVWLDEEGEP